MHRNTLLAVRTDWRSPIREESKGPEHPKAAQESEKNAKAKLNPLPIAAGAVVVIALAVTLLPRLLGDRESTPQADAPIPVSGDSIEIRADEINSRASYFDYDAYGTTVELFAVRAFDGSIRLALNTCQVCNGSPYAYFVQEGDDFVCQNCMNRFASIDVGLVSGGCNPVPVTQDVYTEQDGFITLPSSFLNQNAYRFENWKQF